jgi:hypothetical protein
LHPFQSLSPSWHCFHLHLQSSTPVFSSSPFIINLKLEYGAEKRNHQVQTCCPVSEGRWVIARVTQKFLPISQWRQEEIKISKIVVRTYVHFAFLRAHKYHMPSLLVQNTGSSSILHLTPFSFLFLVSLSP